MNPEILKSLKLNEIAELIGHYWVKVNFGAKPYLNAMHGLSETTDTYGLDDAKSIVLYFLSNASGFRGPEAKMIKAELKRRFGVK